jgi:hypothetical protein
MKLTETILSRRQKAEDYLRGKRKLWDECENILHGNLGDDLSNDKVSRIFDPKLSTLSLERSSRVMAQLPVGKVRGISSNDEGGALLMNLILEKYILPNANSQFDFLTKARMVNLYSNIYGNFFVLTDMVGKTEMKNGYVGPDMWLIPIRDVFPQVGAVSIDDSDYIIIRSWKPYSWFEGLSKNKDYKNIDKVLADLKDKSGDKAERDYESKTQRESGEYPDEQPAKGKGYFEVLSMYEKDRWVDYVKSADLIIKDTDAPEVHQGELPVINKYSIPLLDDFMGMGDFERGKSMQYGVNALWNLYLDAIRISIFPPMMLDKDKIADPSSIKWASAAKWLMRGSNTGFGAQPVNLSPQGTNTFNNVYGVMNASILNQYGTSDTTVSQDVDSGFGKTPKALEMQARRENSRDSVDRFYTEQFLSKVVKKFVNMMSKSSTGNVAFRMFEDEIAEIEQNHPEIRELYDEKTGKLTINKGKYGSTLYDYEIVHGSTFEVDQKEQQGNLINLLGVLTNQMQPNPQTGEVTSPMIEALKSEGKEVKIGELFTRILANSGIKDWDKIVSDKGEEALTQEMFEQADQQLMQAVEQTMGNVENVPPEPQMVMPEEMSNERFTP